MSLNHFLDQFNQPINFPLYHHKFSHYTFTYTIHNNTYYPLYLINHFKSFQPPYYYHTSTHPIVPTFDSLHKLLTYYIPNNIPITL